VEKEGGASKNPSDARNKSQVPHYDNTFPNVNAGTKSNPQNKINPTRVPLREQQQTSKLSFYKLESTTLFRVVDNFVLNEDETLTRNIPTALVHTSIPSTNDAMIAGSIFAFFFWV